MSRLVVLTVTALLLLAGCTSSDGKGRGEDGQPTAKPPTTKTTPAPTGPACASIWKEGTTLPADYTKCVDGGAYGSQDVTKCQDGTRLVTYSDTYFAVTGGRISKPKVAPMQDTPEFGKVYSACTGE
ncbi:hypothetical protein ASC61_18020 [Aeromicrobium sp. Root344]|uniref:hypothetical protein n=1 Tax=Aeromicrobium sp. Root344 TaxID=1736521 RepID=UPI0006FBB7A1|nr:hypothetical protein [Aeromicrobium sp. Root344]KQV76742.1 hypothetical protein ASC61_18020 [Aeromicrobium sp. Root344]